MRTPTRSLPIAFFAGSVPLLVFLVLCLATTFAVVEVLEAHAVTAAEALDQGRFTSVELKRFVRWVEASWGMMFLAMLAAIAAHGVTAWRSYRGLSRRLDSVADFLDARLAGAHAEELLGGRACAIGRLEETVMEEAQAVQERAAQVRELSARQAFEGKVARALDLLDHESEIFDLVGLALQQAAPGNPGELLLTDSSQAHLRRAASTTSAGSAGCPVRSPDGCAAVRRGATLTFSDSTELDACPRLRQHAQGACSATCAPVSVMG